MVERRVSNNSFLKWTREVSKKSTCIHTKLAKYVQDSEENNSCCSSIIWFEKQWEKVAECTEVQNLTLNNNTGLLIL